MNDFCVFILTHGRPNNVVTIKTLRKAGYTGQIKLIIDNEDETAEQYYNNFGKENVIMFNKESVSKTFDEGDNFDDRRTITYARNACFNIAKKIGKRYFIQLDDDYKKFAFRPFFWGVEKDDPSIKDLDAIFNIFLEFYKKTNFLSIAFAQGGDFIGGRHGAAYIGAVKRKCMNSFICSINRPFKFIGRFNEDVNTYTTLGSRGNLFLTVHLCSLSQKTTQSNDGGITELYKKFGTYVKSFTTVMMQPSSVKISMINSSNSRIHHKISWENTVPCIINQKYKKQNAKILQNDRIGAS